MASSILNIIAWILPLFLLTFSGYKLILLIIVNKSGLILMFRQNIQAVVITSLLIPFLLFDIPFLLTKFFDITTPSWKFWLQTITGNWSADSYPPIIDKNISFSSVRSPFSLPEIKQYRFYFSANLAFWLNNAILFVFTGVVWRYSIERGKQMNIATAVKLRDAFAKNAAEELAESNFPSTPKEIGKLFKEALILGQKDLEKHLPAIDKKGSEVILTLLRDTNINFVDYITDSPKPG